MPFVIFCMFLYAATNSTRFTQCNHHKALKERIEDSTFRGPSGKDRTRCALGSGKKCCSESSEDFQDPTLSFSTTKLTAGPVGWSCFLLPTPSPSSKEEATPSSLMHNNRCKLLCQLPCLRKLPCYFKVQSGVLCLSMFANLTMNHRLARTVPPRVYSSRLQLLAALVTEDGPCFFFFLF